MAYTEIRINEADLQAAQQFFNQLGNESDTALYRAINKTLTGVKTDAADIVYQDLNLTKTRIKKNMKIRKAFAKQLNGSFISIGKPINLASFGGTRQTKKGLSVKVKRAGTRSIIRHAFLWERATQSGTMAKTAFWRDYTGERAKPPKLGPVPTKRYGILKGRADRYRTIETLQGPRIEDILGKPANLTLLNKKAGERFVKNAEHEVDYIMDRAR